MGCNLELTRKLFFYSHQNYTTKSPFRTNDVDLLEYFHKEGYEKAQIDFQINLLTEAGFLQCVYVDIDSGFEFWVIFQATFVGRDFIRLIMNENIWQLAMKRVQFMDDISYPQVHSILKECASLSMV